MEKLEIEIDRILGQYDKNTILELGPNVESQTENNFSLHSKMRRESFLYEKSHSIHTTTILYQITYNEINVN